MGNWFNIPGQKSINITVFQLHFSAVVFLIALILLPSCKKPEEKRAAVDFSDRVQIPQNIHLKNSQPLKIAVAAMISPKETAHHYDQMMGYVSHKLGRPVNITQKKTYAEVNDMLERKKLDLAFVCSGPYVTGKKKFGMELLVAPMLYGKPFYQAYFIVHKDSPIKDINGLKGKRFAFTDPASNTGKLVPTYILSKMGSDPEHYFKEVIFTYSHDNSIKAVSKKLVDGASVDGLIWDYYNDKDPDFISSTKVIFKSPLYGIPPVVVHPQTPQSVKEELKIIFLEMHKDPEGNKILSALRIEKFIVPDDSSYNSIREMQSWIDKQK